MSLAACTWGSPCSTHRCTHQLSGSSPPQRPSECPQRHQGDLGTHPAGLPDLSHQHQVLGSLHVCGPRGACSLLGSLGTAWIPKRDNVLPGVLLSLPQNGPSGISGILGSTRPACLAGRWRPAGAGSFRLPVIPPLGDLVAVFRPVSHVQVDLAFGVGVRQCRHRRGVHLRLGVDVDG